MLIQVFERSEGAVDRDMIPLAEDPEARDVIRVLMGQEDGFDRRGVEPQARQRKFRLLGVFPDIHKDPLMGIPEIGGVSAAPGIEGTKLIHGAPPLCELYLTRSR